MKSRKDKSKSREQSNECLLQDKDMVYARAQPSKIIKRRMGYDTAGDAYKWGVKWG